MIRDECELVQKDDIIGSSPRTADAEVDAAIIFDPFSSSSDRLFQDTIPCCIHLGNFSYANCNLPRRSCAVEGLSAKNCDIYIIIKHCIMQKVRHTCSGLTRLSSILQILNLLLWKFSINFSWNLYMLKGSHLHQEKRS